ncbi:hypothetical protein L208DRAFT_1411488, partial [Tricholoma matsutake]
DDDRNHGEDEHGTRDNGNNREHEGDRMGQGHHKSMTTNRLPLPISNHQWTMTMMHGSLSLFGA